MRIDPTSLPRLLLGLALAATTLGLAPAAATQNLALTVGDPVAYRVNLPEGWATQQDGEMLLLASEEENFVILVAAEDLVAGDDEPLPMPEAEARRILTTMIMGSDSLLLQLIEQSFLYQNEYPITDLTHEIGTLGGERSVHLSARVRQDGEDGWFQFHVTMKDGVLYMLGFMGTGELSPQREPLMDRIHDSFVLADAPPVAAARRSTRGRRSEKSR